MRLKKVAYAMDYLKAADHALFLNEGMPQVTGEGQSVELEIGCGKGDFILARAKDNPGTTYYAVEKFDSVLVRAVEKLGESDEIKGNLNFILGDAGDLRQIFAPNSVQKIYLNFSDPWPKKKHAKRRLTFRTKLNLYREILSKRGILEIKTDNSSLFESSILELSQNGWQIEAISVDVHQSRGQEEVCKYQTEYEKKFIKKNMPIYFIRAIPQARADKE